MPTMHQSLGQRGNVTVFTGLIDIQHIAAAYRAEARVRVGPNTRPSFVFYYCPLTCTKNYRQAGCVTKLSLWWLADPWPTLSTRTRGRRHSAKNLNVCASRATLSIGRQWHAVVKDNNHWPLTAPTSVCIFLF